MNVPKNEGKPTVGILYICTGKYSVFWEIFYSSAKKFFLTDVNLKFFVFTDNNEILNASYTDVTTTFLKSEPWPFPTLMRFRTFLSIEEKYDEVDYLLFCNSNLQILKPVLFEDIFNEHDMFVTVHPGYEGKLASSFPYESNINSSAFFENKTGQYVCGGFNGGKKQAYLKMCRVLNDRIQDDLKKKIIAIWHDETHLNKYYNENYLYFRVLPADYCFPQEWDFNRKIKISILNKADYIGVSNKGIKYAARYHLGKFIRNIKLYSLKLWRKM